MAGWFALPGGPAWALTPLALRLRARGRPRRLRVYTGPKGTRSMPQTAIEFMS